MINKGFEYKVKCLKDFSYFGGDCVTEQAYKGDVIIIENYENNQDNYTLFDKFVKFGLVSILSKKKIADKEPVRLKNIVEEKLVEEKK